MKKSLFIITAILFSSVVLFYNLPMEFHFRKEIDRGNELINNIDRYYEINGTIPSINDWKQLRNIGFTDNEMERAYPELRRLNDTTYELIFNLGFDPPYLMWNSTEKIWKEDFPSIPDSWKKNQ